MYEFNLDTTNKTHDQIRAVVEKHCVYSFWINGSNINFPTSSYPGNLHNLSVSTTERNNIFGMHNKKYREYLKTFGNTVLPIIQQELTNG